MGFFERSSFRFSRSMPDADDPGRGPVAEAQPGTTDPSGDPGPLEPSGASEGLPRITRVQGGRYVITDGAGRQIGTIRGDYVIGFTVTCWDSQRRFSDLDQASAAISAEANARIMARLPAPS